MALFKISGVLWNDSDSDGIIDGNEGVTGARVVKLLDSNGNEILRVESGVDGKFVFENVSSGKYRVTRDFPKGYYLSKSATGYVEVVVPDDKIVVNLGSTTVKPEVVLPQVPPLVEKPPVVVTPAPIEVPVPPVNKKKAERWAAIHWSNLTTTFGPGLKACGITGVRGWGYDAKNIAKWKSAGFKCIVTIAGQTLDKTAFLNASKDKNVDVIVIGNEPDLNVYHQGSDEAFIKDILVPAAKICRDAKKLCYAAPAGNQAGYQKLYTAYKNAGVENLVDGFDVHPYDDKVAGISSKLEWISRLFPGKPLISTEAAPVIWKRNDGKVWIANMPGALEAWDKYLTGFAFFRLIPKAPDHDDAGGWKAALFDANGKPLQPYYDIVKNLFLK